MPCFLWSDVRLFLRILRRQPIAFVLTITSLALAIGANATVLGIINSLLLRQLSVHDPGRLIALSTIHPDRPDERDSLSLSMFDEIRKRNQVFSAVFAWDDEALRNMEADGVKYPGAVTEVSGEFFSTLGIEPMVGRLIGSQDVAIGTGISAHVAVLDYRCWERRFRRAPDVVGRVLWVNGVPLTIVGVTPKSFLGLNIDASSDAVVPLGFTRAPPKDSEVQVVARLKPNVTLEQARAHLKSIWPAILETTVPERLEGTERAKFLALRVDAASAATGASYLRRQLSLPLARLMGLAGIALLIACVNLANQILARAAARGHELGIRVSLGASMWALMRLLLVESLLVSIVGLGLGLACAFWASQLLLVNLMTWQSYLPLSLDPSPDLHVIVFSVGISVLIGVLCAWVPARLSITTDPIRALQQGNRSNRDRGVRGRRLLVRAQVAFSLVLMIGATQLGRSFQKLNSLNPGFRREQVLTMELFPQVGRAKIPNRLTYYREVVDRLLHLPGIESVSYAQPPPMIGVELKEPVSSPSSMNSPTDAVRCWVGPSFFQTLGMRVIAGREFEWRDDERAPRVAIVSESLARRLFPARNPIGQLIDIGENPDDKGLQISGIVNSASLWRLQSQQPMAVYIALMQSPKLNQPQLLIRTTRNSAPVALSAARVIESLGHHYSVRTQTLQERAKLVLTNERLISATAGFFAGLTILLASLGLYALISYSVASRTSEIGLRLALGAQRENILRMMLRDVIWLVLPGIAVGVPLAIASIKLIADILFGIPPYDLSTLGGSVIVLAGIALLAGYFPARRASVMDPVIALHCD